VFEAGIGGSGDPTLAIPAGSATSAGLGFIGDLNTGIFSPGADTFAITTGGAEAVRVDSLGRVGIGLTPSSTSTSLEVIDTAFSTPGIKVTAVGAAAQAEILLQRAEQRRAAQVVFGFETGLVDEWITGILRNGGINTTTYAISTEADMNAAEPAISATTGHLVGIGTHTPGGRLHVATPTESNALFVDNVDGFVGIGRTTPVGRFHVATTAGNESFVVDDATGNVGVGTSSPGQALEVVRASGLDGATPPTVKITSTSDGTWTDDVDYARLDFSNNDGSGLGAGATKARISAKVDEVSGTNTAMAFFTSSGVALSEKMRIDVLGNVGIGNTGPSEKLDVTGNIAVSGTVDGVDIATDVIVKDGSKAFTGNQSMGSNKITSLADGTASSDAANVGQLSILTTTAKSGDYSVTAGDGVLLGDASGGVDITLTLPAVASCSGEHFWLKKVDSSVNKVIVEGNGGTENIDGATTFDLTTQYDSIEIVCDGTEWHILSSNL
jgi:hypothetical protein